MNLFNYLSIYQNVRFSEKKKSQIFLGLRMSFRHLRIFMIVKNLSWIF